MPSLDRLRGAFASFRQRQWEAIILYLRFIFLLGRWIGRFRGEFYGVLASLRQRQRQRQRGPITLYIGLDYACRDFLLRMLRGEVLEQPQPILHGEEFVIREVKFKAIDLGDPQIARRVWKDYGAKLDAIVYILNTDRHPCVPPTVELDALLLDEALANVPLLVLVKDRLFRVHLVEGPLPALEPLLWYLKIDNLKAHHGRVRPLEVFMCNIGDLAHEDGFEWLSQCVEGHIYQPSILVLSEGMIV